MCTLEKNLMDAIKMDNKVLSLIEEMAELNGRKEFMLLIVKKNLGLMSMLL